jgi:hypothetical protein
MPITIKDLNEKYGAEDAFWDFKSFPSWLAKKGITSTIAMEALKQILVDTDETDLPDRHHDFDQMVLKKAKELTAVSEEILIQALQEQLDAKLSKYEADWNSLSRIKKIWEVLRGRA